MMENKVKPEFIFLMGQTASGKSAWAMQLARKLNAVIFNCDSVQCYQGVDIGAAKPSAAERNLVPHFLYDYVPVGHSLTAGQYRRDFFEVLERHSPQRIIVVGGTGFYFQAIEKGMFDIPEASDEIKIQVQEEMKSDEGRERLYQELLVNDSDSANTIHPQDHFRLGRAIEVLRFTGRSLSSFRNEFGKGNVFPYRYVKMGIRWEKPELQSRIEQRTSHMIKHGLINETKELLKQTNATWSPLQSVGYKQVVQFLSGEIEERDLQDQINQATWQLAKKQKTWFQRDSAIQWFDGNKGCDPVGEFVKSQGLFS